MNYNIFFHNDVDGVITAALFLQLYAKNKKHFLNPVKSTMRGDKFENMLIEAQNSHDKIIILDYQYSDRADIWIDHHWNKSIGGTPIINKKILYDPTEKSAARLLYKNIFGSDHIVDPSIIQWCDIIDTADFPSVGAIFDDTNPHPLMMIMAYIELSAPVNKLYTGIVDTLILSDFDLEKTIHKLGIDKSIITQFKNRAAEVKKDMLISGSLSILYQNRENKFPRYSEYLIIPDIKYALKITSLGNNISKISIGCNKWNSNPVTINVGMTLSSFSYLISAGGHYNVGAGIIENKNLDKFIEEISSIINKTNDEVEMEKYGVDKSDPVEKEAQEIAKLGEKNINEARKDSLKKITKEGNEGNNVQGVQV